MKYPSITISEYFDACHNARLDCIRYITDLMDAHDNDLEVGDDDYGDVTITYNGGNHPEYASNAFSIVTRVYVDCNDDIVLETEDCDAYDLDDVDTQDIISLAVYLHQRYDE